MPKYAAPKHPRSRQTFRWWALAREVHHLPVIFRTRKDAEANADPGERLFRVTVRVEREMPKRTREYEGCPF
jgi:uncharacterized protein YcaQ